MREVSPYGPGSPVDALVLYPTERQAAAMVLDSRVTANSLPLNALYLLASKGNGYLFMGYAHKAAGVYDADKVK